jgi:hypothetical protein
MRPIVDCKARGSQAGIFPRIKVIGIVSQDVRIQVGADNSRDYHLVATDESSGMYTISHEAYRYVAPNALRYVSLN